MEESLKEIITKAVRDGIREGLAEINILGQSNNGLDQNELLTVEQVHQEYKIGINKVRKMFNDQELPVQRYTTPFKVTRKAVNDYINGHHDYLRG